MLRLLLSRIAFQIYLVGIVQIAIIVVGFDFYVRRFVPHPPSPGNEQALYLAHRFEQVLRRSELLEDELRTANEVFFSDVALRDPDGKLAPGGGQGCEIAGAKPAHRRARRCHVYAVTFPDGRTGQVEVSTMRPGSPAFLPSFVLFAMLVVGVGSWVFTRRLTRPLQGMCVAARAFGAGDLDARVGGQRRDELGQLARSFDEMAERIQGLLNVERELLAGVSHEFRTPLARMRVALDLGNEGDAASMRDALAEISDDLDELERLIDDVMTTTRLSIGPTPSSNGFGPLRMEDVDVLQLLNDVARRFRAAQPSRPVVIRTPAEEQPRIVADPVLLRRAIANLLENAHKYTPEGSAPIELSTRGGDPVEIAVVDRGVGIDDHDIAVVFQPFFRADKSRSRATGGFGLGLALVKRIVEAHAGTIILESRPEEGTRALIRLPAGGTRNFAPVTGADRDAPEGESQ